MKSRANRKSLRVISLFSGAGGLDLGLEAAGFSTSICVEIDPVCCSTLKKNRDWLVFNSPVEKIKGRTLLKQAGLKRGEPALLVGGPPCQPFSKSGYWRDGDSKRLKDPRARTLGEFMRMLEETLPHAFILENVEGLNYEGKDEGFRLVKRKLAQINKRTGANYSFNWKKLNSVDFGVPQIRERIFIVGIRGGKVFQFPEPFCHAEQPVTSQRHIRTTWDAIGDLDGEHHAHIPSKVGGSWGALLPTIPEGQNYLWHTERGGGRPLFEWRSRFWSFLLKLAKSQPSWTIQAQPGTATGPFHWKNRKLTDRELARIQTFPDDFDFSGSHTQIQKQIGNAVPCLLGEVLGRSVLSQVFGIQNPTKLELLPPKRRTIPSPTPISRVPSRFLRR